MSRLSTPTHSAIAGGVIRGDVSRPGLWMPFSSEAFGPATQLFIADHRQYRPHSPVLGDPAFAPSRESSRRWMPEDDQLVRVFRRSCHGSSLKGRAEMLLIALPSHPWVAGPCRDLCNIKNSSYIKNTWKACWLIASLSRPLIEKGTIWRERGMRRPAASPTAHAGQGDNPRARENRPGRPIAKPENVR